MLKYVEEIERRVEERLIDNADAVVHRLVKRIERKISAHLESKILDQLYDGQVAELYDRRVQKMLAKREQKLARYKAYIAARNREVNGQDYELAILDSDRD